MNEPKLEIKSEKENKGENEIKDGKNLFNSSKNLIKVKTQKLFQNPKTAVLQSNIPKARKQFIIITTF